MGGMNTVTAARPDSARAVWAGVLGVAAAGWTVTIWVHGSMAMMTLTDLGLGRFTLLWLPMMTAMMLPSITPTARLWIRSISRAPARNARLAGFAAGYLIAWTATAPLAFSLAVGIDALHQARWLTPAALLTAGLYQITPLKQLCLRKCRSPISSLLRFASLQGPLRDVRAGTTHGSYCIGCCLALMSTIVVLGAMNLWLMAGLTAVVALEKTWRYGEAFSRAAAVAMIAGASALAAVAYA
jgi:predicted metal-binding membrane protein